MRQTRLLIVYLLCITQASLIAQDNDCATTSVIACDNSTITINPSGTGIDDFLSLENDSGCLSREYASVWIVFSFNNLTPPGSEIEFTISPNPQADFDFAVYGPDYDCSSLGSPIICSYADGNSDTGAGNGATDTSEGGTGDGFVAPITVNPNETYVLLVDDFANDGGSFDLNWGGSAAPYIQCCPLTANAGPDLMVCEGDPAFMLNGSASASNGPVNYSWSATNGGLAYLSDPNSPTPMVSIPSGVTGTFVYTLTATDSECMSVSSMVLDINSNPTTSITASSAAICPGSDISLSANGMFSSYQWSTGETAPTILVSTAGTYSVVATDANGCSASSSISVSTLTAPAVEITGNTIICAEGTTTLDAGSGYSSYLWSTGQISQKITVQSAGTYFVTVTDGNGCEGIGDIEANIQEDLTPSISGNLSFCLGESTTLEVDGSYASYEWSTGETTQQITVSTAGTYSVTVSDGNCEAEVAVTVTENQLPTAIISGNSDFCEGSTILLSVNTGFDYEWSTGDNSQSINIATPGDYEVTITDANGCSGSAQITTIEFPNPIPVITGNTSICSGSSTTLDAGDGYTDYQWSNGQTGQSAVISNPGVIDVMVTDVNGCTGTSLVNINETESPTISISGPVDICSNEIAKLTADAGFDNYEWSNEANGQSIEVNTAGTYSVTATDANGCTAESSFTLNISSNLDPIITGDLSFCTGDSTTLDAGEVYASYEWSNGSDTPTINVSEAGNYTLTVTNAEGCTGELMVTVEENELPNISIQGESAICEGASTTLSVSNDYASYEWSNGSNVASIELITAGTYSVIVTDTNGCEANDQFDLTVNTNPTPEIIGNQNFCQGSSTILEGEFGFTTYTWTGGIDDHTLEVNTPGTYELEVIDSNGCTGSTYVEISENAELTPVIQGDLSFCVGTTTTLDVGADFDTYNWSNNSNTQTLIVNQAGDYTVTVTKGDCSGTATVSVVEYALPQPEIIGNSAFCEGTTANLSVQDIYTEYNWSTGNTTSNSSVDESGMLSVSVTDENGCQNTATIEITALENPSPIITGELGFCPNNSTTLSTTEDYTNYEWSTSDSSNSVIIDFSGAVSLSVADENGCVGSTEVIIEEYQTTTPQIQGVLDLCPGDTTILSVVGDFESYQWSNSDDQEASLQVSEAGVYEVTVTDINGCETTASVATNTFPVVAPQILGDNKFCKGSSTILTGIDGYNAYSWLNETNTQTLEINDPGVYTLAVVDENGCSSEASIEVTEYALPEVSISGATSFCIGGSTTLDAGAGFASYQWSDNSTNQLIEINTPGQLSVLVTDVNGCQNTAIVDVQQDTELSVSIQGDLEICDGESTTLSPVGSFASYQWSNNSNEPNLTTTEAGSYALTVTDENGCSGTTSVEIAVHDLPNPQILGDFSFCEGETTTLSLNETYEIYTWSTNTGTSTIETGTAGNYSVEVVDLNGCTAIANVDIEVFSLPNIEILGNTVYCAGESTELSVNGSFASYNWSNGDVGANTTIDQAGLYQIIVSTAQNCVASASIEISEIPLPEAYAGEAQTINCENTSATLGGTNLPEGAFTYSWTGPGINTSNQNEHQPVVNIEGIYTLVVQDLEYGCTSEPATVEIEDVRYEPVVVLEVSDVLDCTTNTVLVNSEGSTFGNDISYQWQDASGNFISDDQHYSATQAGLLSLTIIDEATACVGSGSIIVEQNDDVPVAIAGTDQEINCLRPQAILNGTSSSIHPNLVFEWSVNTNGNIISDPFLPTITVDSEGTYRLIVTDTINGCTSEDIVEVFGDFEMPIADAGVNQTLDCSTTSIVFDASHSSAGSQISYQWYNAQGEIIAESIDLEVEEIGTYRLVVTDNRNGCVTEDQVEVLQMEGELNAYDVELKSPTCFGDDDASISIINIQGGEGPFLYSINDEAFSADSDFNSLTAGVYIIAVQDANGCEVLSEVTIEEGNDLQVNFGEDLSIKLGETVTLNGNVNVERSQLEEISWKAMGDDTICDDCIVFDASPMRTSEYVLTVIDNNGCVASDDIRVFVDARDNVFIPNAFSPNGDGNNDRFTIFGGDDVAQIKSMRVFDRWGELMFEESNFDANDEQTGWDGQFRGQPKSTGIYIYSAEIEFIDGSVKVFKGDVLLKK